MKQAFILTFFVFVSLSSFALTDRVRVGLYTSPGIAWSRPAGKDLTKGTPRFGIDYGFMVEYWFVKNFGASTGIGGSFDGCNLKGRDAFQQYDTLGNITRSAAEKYGFHYVVLPAYVKMKTNELGDSKFTLWGQVGVDINITVSARANYSDSIGNDPAYLIEKENILRGKNEVAKVSAGFRSNLIDVRLGAGAGFEYAFDDRTSLLVGVLYRNGFINNIIDKDPKKEPNLMRFFSLRVGVLF